MYTYKYTYLYVYLNMHFTKAHSTENTLIISVHF